MSRGMTRQRDELHAVDDRLGASKGVPLTGLDVRRCDGLRALEERLRILRRLTTDFRPHPKSPPGLPPLPLRIWPLRCQHAHLESRAFRPEWTGHRRDPNAGA